MSNAIFPLTLLINFFHVHIAYKEVKTIINENNWSLKRKFLKMLCLMSIQNILFKRDLFVVYIVHY